jgi:hypothetical protein
MRRPKAGSPARVVARSSNSLTNPAGTIRSGQAAILKAIGSKPE